jgi:peptidoglycan/xylan/chitin deacetylase (PgdA/CDA1 family)
LIVRRAAPLLAVVLAGLTVVAGCGRAAQPKAAGAQWEPPPAATGTGAPPAPAAGTPDPARPGADPAPRPGGTTTTAPPTTAPPTTAPSTTAPPWPTRSLPGLDTLGPAGSARHTGTDAVALTFDDGPDPVNTPALLDLLKEQGVKATFCVVGFRARDYPEIIARIAAEGHTLCNHSWQHLEGLSQRPASYIMWDLQSTQDVIHKAAPNAKVEYFRAPYGNFTARLDAFAARFGLKPIYWDVDDECYQTARYGFGPAMANHMTRLVQHGTRPGSIILSHENGKPHTVATYRTLLPWLKQHYKLAPLPVSPQPTRPIRDLDSMESPEER